MSLLLDRNPQRSLPRGTADEVDRRLFPDEVKHGDDPDGWATERLGIESWSKPREIRESVVANRHTAVPACHDSAKTHTAASIVSWWLDVHPVGEAFAVTTAPSQHQVETLLWDEIRTMHDLGDLEGRITPKAARWTMRGEKLVAFGRKSADEADPKKAMQAFQGKHARFMLVVIDEAGGVPKWLFDAVDALATNRNARVLAIGNPDDPTSEFAAICAPGTKWNVIPISAFDTPAFTGEPVSEVLRDEHLISQVYVDEMALLGEDSHLYQSKVLGQFPDVSDDTLFPPRILKKAIDAELIGFERGGYGVDVARMGSDETCIYRNRGGVIRFVDGWHKQDTEESADRIAGLLDQHGAANIPAMVDAVGVGAGVFDKLRRRGYAALDFNAGERALEPDRFVNRRAEVFWTLRQRMDDGEIDLDEDDKQLLTQLGRIKWKQVTGGRVQIESKEEMRKRGVKSPDRADAAAMALAAPVTPFDVPDPQPAAATLTDDLFDREL